MTLKYGQIELISSFSIWVANLVIIEIEVKKHIVQITANDFNGSTNLCFRNVCNFLMVSFGIFASLDLSHCLVYS